MKTRRLKELEIVKLTHDISEHKLLKGDEGTIVEVYKNGEAYEVEFISKEGKTVALLTLKSDDISSIKRDEILHIRGFSTA